MPTTFNRRLTVRPAPSTRWLAQDIRPVLWPAMSETEHFLFKSCPHVTANATWLVNRPWQARSSGSVQQPPACAALIADMPYGSNGEVRLNLCGFARGVEAGDGWRGEVMDVLPGVRVPEDRDRHSAHVGANGDRCAGRHGAPNNTLCGGPLQSPSVIQTIEASS